MIEQEAQLDKLSELKRRLAEVDDLDNAAALLEWDQLVMMPPAGAEGRSHQYATLQKIGHEKFVDEAVGRLIEDLSAEYADAPADDDDAALLRVARRLYARRTRLPAALVEAMSQATQGARQQRLRGLSARHGAHLRPQAPGGSPLSGGGDAL